MSLVQDKPVVKRMAHRVGRNPGGCRCNTRDIPVLVWDVPNKDKTRLARALNGNTSVGVHLGSGVCTLAFLWSLIHIRYILILSVARCAVSPRNPGLPADAEVSGEVEPCSMQRVFTVWWKNGKTVKSVKSLSHSKKRSGFMDKKSAETKVSDGVVRRGRTVSMHEMWKRLQVTGDSR